MTRLYLASVRPLARRFRDTALLDVARTYASRVFAQCVLFVSLKTINVYHTTDYLLALAPSIFMRCALDPDDAGAARGICASSLISSSSPSSHSSGGFRHCSFRLCISVGVARLVMLGLQLGDEVHLGLERHC